MVETTAWGTACLAGLAMGVWSSLEELQDVRKVSRVFLPETLRQGDIERWKRAVLRAKAWEQE